MISAIHSQAGFVLKRFVDLTNWKSAPMRDIQLQRITHCPSDYSELEVLASLVGLESGEQVDLGYCPECGLVTYMDAPSPEAADHYYRSVWMGQSLPEAIAEAQKHSQRTVDASYFQQIPIDHARPILEIGVGTGHGLPLLTAGGFSDIRGLENCPVRAEAVRQVFGIPVSVGDFAATEFADKFALLCCHHVLEHVLNPDAFIAQCAAIQNSGDVLLLSVPDFVHEPSVGVLLFWPHVHSFSKHSLARLLAKHGYGVVADMSDAGLFFVARKGDVPAIGVPPITKLQAQQKLLAGLGMGIEETLLTWQRDFDGATWQSTRHNAYRQYGEFPRQMLIEPVKQFRTSAPIEIQFPGRVEMCFK
jgi:SAM-dependent methyltransferase